MSNIWIKKPMEAYEADIKKSQLKRVLGKWSLTAIGIGAIIGGGIFVQKCIPCRIQWEISLSPD
jgi:APA family basic amino acid/polyamine antiporter